MKFVDQQLYLEFSELVECGVSENTIRGAKQRNSSSWKFIDDPSDRRKVLIQYEALRDEYKGQVEKRFGNPYDYIAKDPIRKLVQKDLKAEEFFLAYRYDEVKKLSIDHVKKYTTAASWLNMLNKLNDDNKKVIIKKQLGLTMDSFWTNISELITSDKIDLASSTRRLIAQMKEYKERGYGSLIDWRFGNKLSAKVNDDFSESLLLELLANPNQYDDVYIAMVYNQAAIQKGYKIITHATVGVWRRKMYHQIIAEREGWAAFDGKFRRNVSGKRPSSPLYLVESDDNHLDLFFLDLEDTTGSKYYHKYKAIVVVDSFNDYVLGYAYSENLTVDLVYTAYANAMQHIRYLTGGWYLPHETKTDNWASKELKPFYHSMGNYIDSPVGSKKRGFIEQFFRTPHWKRCLKMGATNYTGNNITAKNRGVNTEVLNGNKNMYPTVQFDAVGQIENFFYRLRMLPQTNGKSKQEEWLEGWAKLEAKDKRSISDEQYLMLFGIKHRPQGRSITITNAGVSPQINNVQYQFDVPPALSLANIGKKVNVVYDPYDMSRVLITDNESLRFIATTTQLAPKALRDYTPGDRTYLNSLLLEKTKQVEYVVNASAKREKVLKANNVDAENLLVSGLMLKEVKQLAELNYQQQNIDQNRTNPWDQF